MKELKTTEKNNLQYVDIIRIFACFMVIINHTDGFVLEKDNLVNSTFFV